MSSEAPWPRPGDVLFSEGDDWLSACVGWTKNQWHGYAEGYRRAGDVLVQHIIDNQRDQDYLIFPIVFLYRQAIEVSLKHVIVTGNALLDRLPELPTGHRLIPLWQKCRTIIEGVWPSGDSQDLDAVGEVLDQFEARDPSSTLFRYPVTLDGQPSMSVSERIDIVNFAETANRIYSLLEASRDAFAEYSQDKWAMARE